MAVADGGGHTSITQSGAGPTSDLPTASAPLVPVVPVAEPPVERPRTSRRHVATPPPLPAAPETALLGPVVEIRVATPTPARHEATVVTSPPRPTPPPASPPAPTITSPKKDHPSPNPTTVPPPKPTPRLRLDRSDARIASVTRARQQADARL